jgi:hypothetical protein
MFLRVLVVLMGIVGLGTRCAALEAVYADCLSRLDNPQRNLEETLTALRTAKERLEPLLAKPIPSLRPEDRALLNIYDLVLFHRALAGHAAVFSEMPEADDSPENERQALAKAVVELEKWLGEQVDSARSDIVAAKRKGKPTRFHPDPKSYEDREKRRVTREEREVAEARIKAIITSYEAGNKKEDFRKMVVESFFYDPPLKQEDLERTADEIRARKRKWDDIIIKLKAGEGKGYTLLYESIREVWIRPILSGEMQPAWRIVQLRFRDEAPGCWIFNYQ